VLPQLRELEQRWPDTIAVVGVHSGKFIAERVTTRIRDACARLGVTHPVVNDRQFRIWREFAVKAWPTLVAIDPEGYVVGMHPGEFVADALASFVERTITDARRRGTLVPRPAHESGEPPEGATSPLRYPGKVAVHGDRIAIADTGHDRVLVATLDAARRRARIELIVGGGGRGFVDGTREEARFDHPQGVAFGTDPSGGDLLWVADAGNHALRAIRLADGRVRTVAGTGRRVRTRAELAAGALASPWDVVAVGDTVHVAMAGTHQLWTVAPAPSGDRRMGAARDWWGSEPDAAPSSLSGGAPRTHPDVRVAPRTGSGAEELHDAPHDSAALAQPMGIALDTRRGVLWFADAEASAVRAADLADDGGVRTVVGTGLFDFGDWDGVGDDVRLQHPQGVALLDDGRLLVADSYNDALKLVEPERRSATTWRRGFAEPAGIACDREHVYVADTNAHRVLVLPIAGTREDDRWELALD